MRNALLLLVLCSLRGNSVFGEDNADDCGGTDDGGGSFSIENPVLAYMVMLALIMFSGLFSGLTLGLLGLDKINLEIVKGGDNVKNAEYAEKIIPIRENGNLLLCTLLLGNVGVNALLSIILADYAGGIAGFILSTVFIVIFGEIIPQATCSRYALRIGANTIPIVKVIMFTLYPLTKPLAMILDKVLGEELGTIHDTGELRKMIEIHEKHGAVDSMESLTITGALKFKDLAVTDVMTPVEDVYMISEEEKLNFKKLREIFQSGFSRIPVYGADGRDDIVGMIFVKDLIFIVPEDETPVKNFIKIISRQAMLIEDDDSLSDVLAGFKLGSGHMAIVRGVDCSDETKDPVRVVRGIITLEDIVEEIIGEEIIDETDVYIDVDNHVKVQRVQFDLDRLKLLDSYKKKESEDLLSHDEVDAISSHLVSNVTEFKNAFNERLLSVETVKAILQSKPVKTLTRKGAEGEYDCADEIYTRDTPSQEFTLILNGQVTIFAGKERFRSTLGSMSVLAAGSLWEESFSPDYTAVVASQSVRCIQISRDEFIWHVKPLEHKKKRKERRVQTRKKVERRKSKSSNSDFGIVADKSMDLSSGISANDGVPRGSAEYTGNPVAPEYTSVDEESGLDQGQSGLEDGPFDMMDDSGMESERTYEMTERKKSSRDRENGATAVNVNDSDEEI